MRGPDILKVDFHEPPKLNSSKVCARKSKKLHKMCKNMQRKTYQRDKMHEFAQCQQIFAPLHNGEMVVLRNLSKRVISCFIQCVMCNVKCTKVPCFCRCKRGPRNLS